MAGGGRIVKTVFKLTGKPPKPGTPGWNKLVGRMLNEAVEHRAICAVSGGKRKDGWPCESPFIKENGRCKMHGGNVPRGADHYNFKHGRYSVVLRGLPKRLREGYAASVKDDDLLSLRSDIALTDARMGELIERLDTGETGPQWKEVAGISARLLSELHGKEVDTEGLQEIAQELSQLSSAALSDEKVWKQLHASKEHRRKLVDTERKRLKDMHAYLTADEALAIIARLTDVIIRHVEDKTALAAILQEVQAITGDDPRERPLLPGELVVM